MSGIASPPLVLASTSPRRRGLLETIGIAFEVVPPPAGVEAAWEGGEPPTAYALRTAAAKADAVAAGRPDALVVAADTIVVLDGDVLGKPADTAEARRMIARLSGRRHEVRTGVAVRGPDARRAEGFEATEVAFRVLGEAEIEAYVATGEPLDKAGGYGIQAYGATLVSAVHGCYFNIMGLPVTRLLDLLSEVGWAYRAPGRLVPIG